MIYSVEMRLTVAQGAGQGGVTGYHLLALLLHLIDRVNGRLAASLHGEGGLKPLTISPLTTGTGRGRPQLSEGAPARFRVTLLQEEVFASLADAVWRLPPDTSLPLGEAWVTCQGLATTPDQSPWAAFSSFSQLLEEAGAQPKVRLAFLSPTTFRSKGERNIIFPAPSLVFGSLLARWNAYAPPELKLSPMDAGAPRLSGYRLSTRMLDFGSYQELGFYGQATYEPSSQLPENQVRAINALADFAFFSGVGAKTTMGMGQCRRWDDARALSHRAGSHPAEGRGAAAGDKRGAGAPEDTCHQG